MKITIVVPVYNVEPYIKDCLASIAAQTYNNDIECIIVNDCTPDGSCVIIEHFIKEYKGNIEFKLLHHTRNRGLSAARNTGIDAATGEYIYFLDSDDEITPECIELLATPLEKEKYDFVIGNYITTNSNIEFPPLLLEEGKVCNNGEIRTSHFTGKWYVMAWNKLCKLTFIRKEKIYFKEGVVDEDELWSFQLACTAQSMHIVKKDTYIYKIRESSITGQQDNECRAIAYSTITNEAYNWTKKKGLANQKEVLRKVLSFREIAIYNIMITKKHKDRIRIYLKCYKKLKINPILFYKNNAIKKLSLFKEFYNCLPCILGYWYLWLYNSILNK